MGKRTLLNDIVDLDELDQESTTNPVQIRDFGIKNNHLSNTNLLRAYIAQFSSFKTNKGSQFQHRSSVIGVVIVLLAFISGYFTAIGLLQYDGSHPVNILSFLGVLFFIQIFSLITFLLGWLGIYSDGLGNLMRAFSISNWISRMGMGQHDWLDRIPVTTWQAVILAKSQLFICFFLTGLLIALLYLASTSDIAFGWSSTLDFSSDAFYRFCSFISAPWKSTIPLASPDTTLIEATRYFRLRDQELINNANTYGGWWRFLAMTLLVWGILPRLITLVISFLVERSVLKNNLINSVAGQDALAIMRTPVVSTQSKKEEAPFNQPQSNESLIRAVLPDDVDYVVFNGAFEAKNVILERLHLVGTDMIEIGAHQSIEDDDAAIDKLKKKTGTIVLVVKAWEPPIMDTMDSIEKILNINNKQKLAICPIASDFSLDKIEDFHIDSWQRAISSLPANRVSLIHKN